MNLRRSVRSTVWFTFVAIAGGVPAPSLAVQAPRTGDPHRVTRSAVRSDAVRVSESGAGGVGSSSTLPTPAAHFQQVQVLSGDQRQAVDSLVGFFRKFGRGTEADELAADFEAGRIRIGPVPDNDNASTDIDTDIITLSPRMVEQILQPGTGGWRFTADWAATIRHERIHTTQSNAAVIASNASYHLGGEQPHEVPAWRAGFQATYDWMQEVRVKLSQTSGEAAREALALQVRGLAQNFIVYEQSFASQHIGQMILLDRDQLGLPLDEALAQVRRALDEANAELTRLDFRIRVAPPRITARTGQRIEVSANRFGGAFGDPIIPNTNDQAFSYIWTVNGTQVGTGRALSRTVTQSEILTVEVQDRLGAKRTATCVVTVEAPVADPAPQPPPARPDPTAVRADPPPAPARADDVPAAPATGRWVLTTKPPFQNTFPPVRIQSVDQGADGFRGIFTFDGKPAELWGRFTPPPPELQPGDLLRVEISTNYDMEVQFGPYPRSNSSRAKNTQGRDETATAVCELPMPTSDPGHGINVQVQVVVAAGWMGMWQFEYVWVGPS